MAFLFTIYSNICDFYRTQVYLGSDLWISVSLTGRAFADLIDVTLAHKDTSSTLKEGFKNPNHAFLP